MNLLKIVGNPLCHPEPEAKGLDSSPPTAAQNDKMGMFSSRSQAPARVKVSKQSFE